MREFNIGSIVPFGGYQWRILDIQGNAALIITEYMIGQQPYNNYSGDVTWVDCSLRRYLNGEFYNKFTETEQTRIIPVLNKNNDNEWYGSKGGEDTLDHIFLLSIEEVVCKYFGDSSKNLENRSPSNDTGFKRKTETTISEDPHSMGIYGGGGFGRPGVTIEEPYIFTAMVM